MRFRNLTHHPFSFPIVILNPLLYPGPCTPTSPRNLLIHVALNPDFLALCGIVEHVIKKDSLGLDLVKLFEGLGGVIDGFVRLLRACQMRKGGSKKSTHCPCQGLHKFLRSREVSGSAATNELLQFLQGISSVI